MKTIYIDYDFKCHITNDGTMTAVETDAFDGKCDVYIEGHRFVPTGKSWTRPDGTVFHGEMKSMWKDSQKLNKAQREHEQRLIAEYTEALNVVGVEV